MFEFVVVATKWVINILCNSKIIKIYKFWQMIYYLFEIDFWFCFRFQFLWLQIQTRLFPLFQVLIANKNASSRFASVNSQDLMLLLLRVLALLNFSKRLLNTHELFLVTRNDDTSVNELCDSNSISSEKDKMKSIDFFKKKKPRINLN